MVSCCWTRLGLKKMAGKKKGEININNFKLLLEEGKIGENKITNWLLKEGYIVMPFYEAEANKAPKLLHSQRAYIAPDILASKGGECIWIEAKHKLGFSWHRKTQRWVTGIDIRNFNDYCEVDRITPWRVHLYFLHKGGQTKDSPNSPAGLFTNSLEYLKENINHTHDNWGKSGMVYWSIDSLKKVADIEEL